jgi:hypothetical protein
VPPAPAHALQRVDPARDGALLVVPHEEAGALPGEGGVVQGALELLRRWRWEAGVRVEGAIAPGRCRLSVVVSTEAGSQAPRRGFAHSTARAARADYPTLLITPCFATSQMSVVREARTVHVHVEVHLVDPDIRIDPMS